MSTMQDKLAARSSGPVLDTRAFRDQADRSGGTGGDKTPYSQSELRVKVDNG